MDEAPWGDLRGRPLDSWGLSRRLAKYQIGSTSVRVDQKILRGYKREDLHDVWLRYLGEPVPSSPEVSATSATSAISLSSPPEVSATSATATGPTPGADLTQAEISAVTPRCQLCGTSVFMKPGEDLCANCKREAYGNHSDRQQETA